MSTKFKVIGGVEIGTSKVKVLVGQVTSSSLEIIGMGECQSHGIIKGAVVDFRAASNAVHNALEIAERNARVKIDGVFLAQTGAHLEGFRNDGVVSVTAANNMVSAMDIDAVCRAATSKSLPEHRTVIHDIQRPFRLDGNIVPDPEHLVGQRLEVSYWTVHGDRSAVSNSIYIVGGYNVVVKELILSSLASGTMVTTPEDRHHGVLVIDIGAGTSDYVLYRHGRGHVTGAVPIGGSHLTNDLCLGLRLVEGQAEKIKHRFGRGTVATRDKTEKIMLNGDYSIGDRQFPKHIIEQITAARTWELFEVIRKKLGLDYSPDMVPAGVVLTGGTSRLAGITDAASKVFEATARIGEFPADIHEQLHDPSYATVLGLLHTGMRAAMEHSTQKKKGGGLFDFIFGKR